MPETRRSTERLPILGDLQGSVMVGQPMRVREISLGGALIETGAPLQLNSLHEIRLTLGGTAFVVQGRVVHSQISDVDQDIVIYRTGVEFVEPSERVAGALATYLDMMKKSRQGG